MEASYSLYTNPAFPGAFGYTAESNAGHSVNQLWTPGVGGRSPMTEAAARASAEALVAEWIASAPA